MAKLKSSVYVTGTPLDSNELLNVNIDITRETLTELAEVIEDDSGLPNEFQTAFRKAVKGFIPTRSAEGIDY